MSDKSLDLTLNSETMNCSS